MIIPFAGNSATGRSTNINAQRTVNCFPAIDPDEAKEKLTMYGTPGLKLITQLEGENSDTCIRRMHVMKNKLYVVVGYVAPRVYEIDTDYVVSLLGTIGNSVKPVFMSDNGRQLLIVNGTSTGYYVEYGVLTTVATADFPTADSVAYQDTYFITNTAISGDVNISGINDVTSWNTADVTIADSHPDKALRVMSSNRELWVFGEVTVEPFYNSGNADFPFERVQGASIQVGTISQQSVAAVNGIFYWLSNTKMVVRNNGYQIQIISNPALDYQLASYSTVSDAIGYNTLVDGHDWYVLTFPTVRKTWVFDTTTNYWFEWESYYNKLTSVQWGRHRSNHIVRFNDKEIVGDYENATLYELDMETATDNGNEIRSIRTGQYINKERKNVIFHNFELEFEAGVGTTGLSNNGVYLSKVVCIPPEILSQPINASTDEGGSVSFSVVGSGSDTITYQWYHGWDDGL